MAFSITELNLVNQSLGRIGANKIVSIADITSNEYVQSLLHYSQTRDALLRSFEWDFAIGQAKLALISNMMLDVEPRPSAWIVGDTITGLSSYVSAEILTVISNTEYEIAYISGTFTDGERITNADVEKVYWEGIEVTYEDEIVLWYDGGSELACGTGYPVVVAIKPLLHYGYQFELPKDYDRLTKNWRRAYHWTIQGHRLLTSSTTANIEYVKKITDPALFDPLFTEVLILALALKLLAPLAGTSTTSLRQELNQELKNANARARTVCAAETNNTGYSGWNLARYGSGKIYPLDPMRLY